LPVSIHRYFSSVEFLVKNYVNYRYLQLWMYPLFYILKVQLNTVDESL